LYSDSQERKAPVIYGLRTSSPVHSFALSADWKGFCLWNVIALEGPPPSDSRPVDPEQSRTFENSARCWSLPHRGD
jgi:hypothetical protein